MPAVHLLGGMCTGHGCYPPRNNVQASPNVFAEGKPVHRQGDMWATHACPPDPSHTAPLAKGSSTVYVNGMQCGRIGDPVGCGSFAADGAGTVFAGG